jgi:hypothetical protein
MNHTFLIKRALPRVQHDDDMMIKRALPRVQPVLARLLLLCLTSHTAGLPLLLPELRKLPYCFSPLDTSGQNPSSVCCFKEGAAHFYCTSQVVTSCFLEQLQQQKKTAAADALHPCQTRQLTCTHAAFTFKHQPARSTNHSERPQPPASCTPVDAA